MKISVVKYERLKKTKESYENERVGVEVHLTDGDDPAEAMVMARAFVNRQLGEGLTIKDAQKKLDSLLAAGVSGETLEKVATELHEQVVDGPKKKWLGLFPSKHEVVDGL